EQPGAGDGKTVEKVTSGVAGPDGFGHCSEHWSGIHALVKSERRGARYLIPRGDSCIDRRSSAPGRKQGEMEIDPPVGGDIQDWSGHEMSVGDHRRGIRRQCAQALGELGITRIGRGQNLDARGISGGSDRTAGKSTTASRTGIRSRDNCNYLVLVTFQKGLQGRDRHLGGSGKDYSHAHFTPIGSEIWSWTTPALMAALPNHDEARIWAIAARRACGDSRCRNSTPSRWSV